MSSLITDLFLGTCFHSSLQELGQSHINRTPQEVAAWLKHELFTCMLDLQWA